MKIDDEDLEKLLRSRPSRLQAILERSRQSIKSGKGLTADAFWETVEQSTEESES